MYGDWKLRGPCRENLYYLWKRAVRIAGYPVMITGPVIIKIKIVFFRASCFGFIVKGVCPLFLPLVSLVWHVKLDNDEQLKQKETHSTLSSLV